jgi:hypothetical protein
MHDYAMLRVIQQQVDGIQTDIHPLESLIWLLSLPFVLLGWLVGFSWRVVLWCVAAIVVGFRTGLRSERSDRGGA